MFMFCKEDLPSSKKEEILRCFFGLILNRTVRPFDGLQEGHS
jgi:hypothetical protein